MTPSEHQRRAEEADAILDLVAAVEAVRAGRDSDVRFLVGGRLDPTFHDLLVSTVARAVAAADRPLPVELGGLSAHTWVEVRRRAREHAGEIVRIPGASSHLPRHAVEVVPASVDPIPVQARNAELVEAFGALLDADDAVHGQGHSARVLATARDMALRAVLPA
ncbi:hypothetical protein GCM10025864_11060 [Luteimicrobium album]|uniref:Uncharacterized protein n=1 Tax=Luteimicrobium album TaxID=1054550 RepID=A0ABQ6HYX3_9MICO|nr:hypothetical protein [Luteimicrobium album]GMA23347.1 hypothetical protein GCM10025864_11060 [Luteimicrobium album]